jgi:Protein of unknown function (DUF3102)
MKTRRPAEGHRQGAREARSKNDTASLAPSPTKSKVSEPPAIGDNSLPDLAARIRAEHEAVAAFMQRSLERAIAAGDLLIEAKAQLAHGQWLPWLQEHCQVPERTAQVYMRLARHAPELKSKSETVADLSVRDAVDLLTEPREHAHIRHFLTELGDIAPGTVISPVHMQLPDDLTFEAWLEVGKLLDRYFPEREAAS